MTQQEKDQALSVEPSERRHQPRNIQPHAAEVLVQQPDGDASFHAVLVNTSNGGMCIRHWRKDLAIGQTAQVSSPAFSATAARVIWNWAIGPVVISGLQKLESRSDRQGTLAPHARCHSCIDNPKIGNSSARKRAKLLACLLGVAAGILLVAAWHFRTALGHLWSWS